jgi:hypothetical protein
MFRRTEVNSSESMQVDVDRRSYTKIGCFLEPTRLVGCVGFTSAFNSALHDDPSDLGEQVV